MMSSILNQSPLNYIFMLGLVQNGDIIESSQDTFSLLGRTDKEQQHVCRYHERKQWGTKVEMIGVSEKASQKYHVT